MPARYRPSLLLISSHGFAATGGGLFGSVSSHGSAGGGACGGGGLSGGGLTGGGGLPGGGGLSGGGGGLLGVKGRLSQADGIIRKDIVVAERDCAA